PGASRSRHAGQRDAASPRLRAHVHLLPEAAGRIRDPARQIRLRRGRVSIQLDHSLAPQAPGARAWWRAVSILLVIAIFLQALFAGGMLSGIAWARAAHMANGVLVVAATLAASLAAFVALRHVRGGLKLGLVLLALAAVLAVQFGLGRMAATGANLMWLHI